MEEMEYEHDEAACRAFGGLALFSALAGCGGKKQGGESGGNNGSISGTAASDGVGAAAEKYTLNESMPASPAVWNPHKWESSGDNYVMLYCETPLVDATIAEDGVNFKWTYEAATSVEDITAEYPDKAKYGISENESGRVFRIRLNPALCWEDGTPINSETYIYSMQRLLSPEMKNYRASSYYSGDAATLNAENYYCNDLAGSPKYGDLVIGYDESGTATSGDDGSGDVKGQILNEAYKPGDKAYFNISQPCAFFGDTLAAYYEGGYADFYRDEDGTDLYAKYFAGTEGYVELTDEMKSALNAIARHFGDDNPAAWREMAFCVTGTYEQTAWEDVGLYAENDYTLIYVTEKPVTMFNFLSSLTSNWIVYRDLYEAGMESKEGLVTTDYGTSAKNYMSYGPYKLVSF
jgi:oligopeptide transport system substrate-binding protein